MYHRSTWGASRGGGFGAALGNDVSRLHAAVGPCGEILAAARKAGLLVIHTREGHRPDLSDAPPIKVERGDPALRIGTPGPMDRILVRGEPGHDFKSRGETVKLLAILQKSPALGSFCQNLGRDCINGHDTIISRNTKIEVLKVR